MLAALRTGVSPTGPSAQGHDAAIVTLNAFGPGYSSAAPEVKREQGGESVSDLQLVSLDASTAAGSVVPTSYDLIAGTVGRPAAASPPRLSTIEPSFELVDDELVIVGTTRRPVSGGAAAAAPEMTRKRKRKVENKPDRMIVENKLEPDRLSMPKVALNGLAARLQEDTSARPGNMSCGLVLLPYARGHHLEEELGGRLLIGHWVAFLCDARPASSRKGVAFVDGHREQGQRVFTELEGMEGYKRSCFYRLCC